MLRAGVCINCAEKIAVLILESSPGELSAGAVLRCLPRGDRAVLLHAARALARAASAVAVGAAVTAVMPRPAIGEAAGAFEIGRASILPENVICVPSASLELCRDVSPVADKALKVRIYWRARRDSNPRPPDSKSGALSS